jgi:hypothetical protein
MSRTIAAILLVAVLAIGGGLIATTAYQAGLNTAVTTAVAGGATVVAPLPAAGYGYGYGYGWHPGGFGLGFFGLLGTLLFVFLVIGLIRALFFRGGHGRRGGWGPSGGTGGPGGGRFWEARLGDSFQEWHRQAHGPESSNEPPTATSGSKPA